MTCRWSGRRLIEFAATGPKPFTDALRALSMETDATTCRALHKLRSLERHSDVSKILEGFATAKNMLEARFVQYTSFLSRAPWNLVGMLQYLLPSEASDREPAIQRSRAFASKLLLMHDLNQLGNLGDVGHQFFSEHRAALTRWSKGHDRFMQQALFRQLVGWASSLLVMKRLEAKHHLVHEAWL